MTEYKMIPTKSEVKTMTVEVTRGHDIPDGYTLPDADVRVGEELIIDGVTVVVTKVQHSFSKCPEDYPSFEYFTKYVECKKKD